jgi:hypothetical protein
MELTKIVFIIIGSFFGIENRRVLADKTTVTIAPEEKRLLFFRSILYPSFKLQRTV